MCGYTTYSASLSVQIATPVLQFCYFHNILAISDSELSIYDHLQLVSQSRLIHNVVSSSFFPMYSMLQSSRVLTYYILITAWILLIQLAFIERSIYRVVQSRTQTEVGQSFKCGLEGYRADVCKHGYRDIHAGYRPLSQVRNGWWSSWSSLCMQGRIFPTRICIKNAKTQISYNIKTRLMSISKTAFSATAQRTVSSLVSLWLCLPKPCNMFLSNLHAPHRMFLTRTQVKQELTFK